MKKYTLIAIATIAMAACNNETKQSEAANNEPVSEPVKETPQPLAANVDPVCGMPKDSTWTDYIVNVGKDTLWFCSPVCKEEYEKKNTQ